MSEGVAVVAAREGVVEQVESRHASGIEMDPVSFYGNFVKVRHPDGSAALYAHLKQGGVVVTPGERVSAGHTLGYSGASGDVVAPMLHFGVTRPASPGSAWEKSVPFRFYVADPPWAFEPRVAMMVTANYTASALRPHFATEVPRPAWFSPPAKGPEDQARGLELLVLFAAAGVAGMVWFWRYSRG
jgi:murein DD-endopeptidase MepM/ murein hydrolase activator NlpD